MRAKIDAFPNPHPALRATLAHDGQAKIHVTQAFKPSMTARQRLLAATLFGFLKPVEQSSGVGSRECLQPVRLALFDRITCDGSFGTKEFCFLLHLAVPHV